MLVTGLIMFSAHATEFWVNPAFVVKRGFIAVAGLNALAFHRATYVTVAGWDTSAPAPTIAKISAAASLLLRIGVISCGRLIAYL